MQSVLNGWRVLRRSGRKVAPYLMLEIFLPGGTLLALLLFVCRRSNLSIGSILPKNILAACRIAPNSLD